MAVRMTTTLGDLARDLEKIAARAPKDLDESTKFVAKSGLAFGKGLARERSRKAGRRYPQAWSIEKKGPAKWELGPDIAKPQGGMDFEEGRGRQTAPHHELADTFDLTAPSLHRGLVRRIDRWFWNP